MLLQHSADLVVVAAQAYDWRADLIDGIKVDLALENIEAACGNVVAEAAKLLDDRHCFVCLRKSAATSAWRLQEVGDKAVRTGPDFAHCCSSSLLERKELARRA